MVMVLKKYFNLIAILLLMILIIMLAIWVSNRLIDRLDQKIPDLGMSTDNKMIRGHQTQSCDLIQKRITS